jgi:hypothetical protein
VASAVPVKPGANLARPDGEKHIQWPFATITCRLKGRSLLERGDLQAELLGDLQVAGHERQDAPS